MDKRYLKPDEIINPNEYFFPGYWEKYNDHYIYIFRDPDTALDYLCDLYIKKMDQLRYWRSNERRKTDDRTI